MNTTSSHSAHNYHHVGFGLGQPVPKIEQINENGTRLYNTPDGRRYPSVTTVTSLHGQEALKQWRDRVGHAEAARIGRRAANRGTRLHKHAEDYLNNQTPEFGLDLISEQLFTDFKPLLHRINNIHCVETRMYSHHLRLAGTVDCIAEFDGRLSVIDFKTASKPKEHHWIYNYYMQCSAYAVMYEELTGIAVPQLVVLISVEDMDPQVFVERRNPWVRQLIKLRDNYETIHNAGNDKWDYLSGKKPLTNN